MLYPGLKENKQSPYTQGVSGISVLSKANTVLGSSGLYSWAEQFWKEGLSLGGWWLISA